MSVLVLCFSLSVYLLGFGLGYNRVPTKISEKKSREKKSGEIYQKKNVR